MRRKGMVCAPTVLFLWIVGFSVDVSAAPPDRTGSNRTLKDQVAAVVTANNRFAFELYQRLRIEKGNLFFSPASISTALAMTYAGAAADTAAQMARTLHFDMPKTQLNAEMHELQNSWITNHKKQGFRLEVANRLWGQEGYHFRDEFLHVTRTDYGAELARLDFGSQPESARQTINAWVKDHTSKKITNLFPTAETLSDARLVLTNAVYFEGAWREPFDKRGTIDEDFHVSADRKVKAPMMHKQDGFRYGRGDEFQILELSYGDGSLAMIILLPDEVGKLNQLEEQLSSATFQTWFASLHSEEVNVALPKYKTSSQFELSETLKSMGMVSAFDLSMADFSGMTGGRDLFLSAVVHKAFVDVHEAGTEAAAATAVVAVQIAASLDPPKRPVDFRADHPFVFLIRDNRTGAILFLGRIVEPMAG